ncbi:MAG: DUF3667 domain-containing protein [Gemmatimonadaceae bacterium]|nr:DUF3667 domain-containing protein [Chitinophagaceae bacterium]
MEQYICKNCGNEFSGTFCNNCGQKPAHRLDAKHIAHEVAHVFTHADRGIFAFIPKIITQPGVVALDYVEGKRKKHFNIFQYLIIIVGVVVFIVSKTHFLENTIKDYNAGEASQRMSMVQQGITRLMQKYFNVILFAFIPVYALVSLLLFRKKGYNFAETVVLHCCIQAQQNTISLVTLTLVYFIGTSSVFYLMFFPLMVAVFCTGLAFRQFFKVSWLQAVVKAIASFLIVNILQLIVIFATILIIYGPAIFKDAK